MWWTGRMPAFAKYTAQDGLVGCKARCEDTASCVGISMRAGVGPVNPLYGSVNDCWGWQEGGSPVGIASHVSYALCSGTSPPCTLHYG